MREANGTACHNFSVVDEFISADPDSEDYCQRLSRLRVYHRTGYAHCITANDHEFKTLASNLNIGQPRGGLSCVCSGISTHGSDVQGGKSCMEVDIKDIDRDVYSVINGP